MLLTDSDFLTTEMIETLEPEVREVADSQSISLEGENSIIRSAWDECADSLLEQVSLGGYLNFSRGSHGLTLQRPRVFLSQIVATESHYAKRIPLIQRWMMYKALHLLYRTASQRTVHDRYQAKSDEYALELKSRWRSLWVHGLPIVVQPLSAPGAIHESNAGEWSVENLSSVSGGSSAAGPYEIAITWVDSTRYQSQRQKQNGESGPSARIAFNVPAGERLRIDISSLNAPDGTVPQAVAFSPLAASGWNVYAGNLGGMLYLQNTTTPITIATKSYTFAGAPVLAGSILDSGQLPDATFAFSRVLHRA